MSSRRRLGVRIDRLAEQVIDLGPRSEEHEQAVLRTLRSLEAKSKLEELAAHIG